MEPTPTSSARAEPGEDGSIEVPAAAVVNCPLVGFDLVQVEKCADCPKFGGLEDRFPGSPAPFAKRYVLKCFGAPQLRPMMMLATKG